MTASRGASLFQAPSAALACLGIWLAVLCAPQIIGRDFGWQYAGAYYLVLLFILALTQAVRIHRRGQTVSEAWTASRAERRLRRERVQRARRDAVVLPWLADQQLDPAASGVLITPAPSVSVYSRAGYDVVLDSAGAHKIPVIKEVRTHSLLAQGGRQGPCGECSRHIAAST